MINPQPAVQS
uniref:Uncharacterized protein n=1 Tax=Arundo donax TaxID=35708 RepID=A0A0A9ANX1_ARUDO